METKRKKRPNLNVLRSPERHTFNLFTLFLGGGGRWRLQKMSLKSSRVAV